MATRAAPAFSWLESAQLLAEGIRSFNDRCARGIEPNVKRIKQHLDNSLMLVSALNPRIGYDKGRADFAAGLSRGSQPQGCRAQLGYLTSEQFNTWVRPADMTR